jgi:hypothetical protein
MNEKHTQARLSRTVANASRQAKKQEKWAAQEKVNTLPGTPYIVGATNAATIFSVADEFSDLKTQVNYVCKNSFNR